MIRKAPTRDGSELAWFKSSYSGGTQGDSCVEIAAVPGTVYVRDSKNVEGPRFTVAPAAWMGFVQQLGEA
ncbi:DUF397 domain-containing protein [Streptomyces sp. STR69]|uniref:DUF397 domain-containing protein n=1 Tax=Streptomyces sp. STR69 TaxID=1796942 RepID=UPI0021C7CF91|nr:DUF397 domain-containing protein [Streptomyces sp. STR69]